MASPSLEQINDNIAVQIQNGKYLTLKTHRMTEVVEKHIQHAIESILDKNKKASLVTTMYTILKELVINGCKANQKRIFFDEQGLDIFNAEDYKEGTAQYKDLFSEEMALQYGLKAKAKGYYVIIDYTFDETGIKCEVINNTPVVHEEELVLRSKLKKAMGYNDIAEFYMDQAMQEAESEGAGLGIALIIILLKGEGIDPSYFRILTEEDRTIARLEIPFTDNFKSKRDASKK